MKDKIKKWIIYKLGGIIIKDLPLNIQREIFCYYQNITIDSHIKNILDNGFTSTKYNLK